MNPVKVHPCRLLKGGVLGASSSRAGRKYGVAVGHLTVQYLLLARMDHFLTPLGFYLNGKASGIKGPGLSSKHERNPERTDYRYKSSATDA